VPVTMDCLAAAHRNIETRSSILVRRKDKISLAERSSSRYLTALILLLALILPLQLYVWTCTNLSKKIDDLNSPSRMKFLQLSDDNQKLAAATSGRDSNLWTLDERQRAEKITADAESLQSDMKRILYELSILGRTSMFFIGKSEQIGLAGPPVGDQWWQHYDAANALSNQAQVEILKVQEKASLIVGIVASFILPILFGTLGAVAYVIRTISDQIKTTTFASNAPVRNLTRAALGALAGVVVGLFSGLSSQLSLSPLAVAFLAGYGVEALFSMFDGIIGRFRQVKS